MSSMRLAAVGLLTLLLIPFPPSRIAAQSSPDSLAVLAAVEQFHRALAGGDSTAALELLDDSAVVLESGGLESRREYRQHHLSGDIAFARAMPSRTERRSATVRGDVAWVVSTGTTTGEYRGRRIDVQGAELVVLSRRRDGWRIQAIHWSSRPRSRPASGP
jgi:ketosteroid isomerase-like protein